MKWHVMPEDQGQIVEVAYAAMGEYGVLRRMVDKSEPNPEPMFAIAEWNPDAPPEEAFQPWNGYIGDDGDWAPISALNVERLRCLIEG